MFDDRSSTISGSSTVGSRLTSYYDVAWLSSSSQQTPLATTGSASGPGSTAQICLTTPGLSGIDAAAAAPGPAQFSSSASASASSRHTSSSSTGVDGMLLLSGVSGGNRDRLPSSPRSPKSPSSSTVSPTPAPVVSISDLSEDSSSNVALDDVVNGSSYWNGSSGSSTPGSTSLLSPPSLVTASQFTSTSPPPSRPLSNHHRIRSSSSERINCCSRSVVGANPTPVRTSGGHLAVSSPSELLPVYGEEHLQQQQTSTSLSLQPYQQQSISRAASLYARRRTVLKAIREKSLSIDIDLISATAVAGGATGSAAGGAAANGD